LRQTSVWTGIIVGQMASNIELFIKKLEQRIEALEKEFAKNGYDSKKVTELVKDSTYGLTLETGDQIRTAYDYINEQIDKAKKHGNTKLVHQLILQKKQVPYLFNVGSKTRKEVLDILDKGLKELLKHKQNDII